MFRISEQTAEPIGVKFFVDTHPCLGGVIGFKKTEVFFHFFSQIFFSDLFLTFFPQAMPGQLVINKI